MMDAMASSSFREHEEFFGELDRAGLTADLKVDDTEILLDVSGDEPVLKQMKGRLCTPQWSAACLTTWQPGPDTRTGRPSH